MHAYRDQYAQTFNLGRGVVLMAISADPIEELASWARDDEFPFLMASDAELDIGTKYGALARGGERTNRSVIVIGPDGRVAHVMSPFREIDPTAYEELAEVIDRLAPAEEGEEDPAGDG